MQGNKFAPKTLLMGAVLGLTAGGFIAAVGTNATAARGNDLEERWVNANLVELKVGGNWEEVHLMPLADHLCQSRNEHYEQYCD